LPHQSGGICCRTGCRSIVCSLPRCYNSTTFIQPYFVELTSQHLTVAGLLNVSFHFPSVPEDTYILAVESYILQSYELQSFSDPSRRAIPQVQKRGLFRFDEQRHRRDIPVTFTATTRPPIPRHIRHPSAAGASAESIGFLSRGGSMQMSHLVRVPDDDYVRPSTQLGTKSVIRISHQIVVAITFRHCHDDGPAKVFRVTRPITFSSVGRILRNKFCSRPY
jgi:hypothetical protein